MTRKQIEAARETRLWIAQIIVPAIIGAVVVNARYPEIGRAAVSKVNDLKRSIQDKFKKN